MERKYFHVKSFGGEICSKQIRGDHKLPITDTLPNEDLQAKYFGDYSYLIYFLPDQSMETDTLKIDLQKWIFGPTFRSQMKNKFEELDLIDFTIEQTTTIAPLQLGDPTISKITNNSMEILTQWQGSGFVFLTFVEKEKSKEDDGRKGEF